MDKASIAIAREDLRIARKHLDEAIERRDTAAAPACSRWVLTCETRLSELLGE